jgi:hypothetical protein
VNIGFVVDGQSEVGGLPELFGDLKRACGHTLLKPLLAPMQPYAPPAAVARAASTRVRQLIGRGADSIVVLIDRELRAECPARLAREIGREIARIVGVEVLVVIKNRTFENWLIADLDALRAQPARFAVSQAISRSVEPNKADNVEAKATLNRCAIDIPYQKVVDARRICTYADPERIARNSRSFRRFLRSIHHPSYRAQSKEP